jgi:hypothetical protein
MLKEMKSHILEAVGNRPNLMKLASDRIFQHQQLKKTDQPRMNADARG